MIKDDFEHLLVNDFGEDEYLIEFSFKDGGKGCVDIFFNKMGCISHIDIEKHNQSENVDIFWEELNTMFGIMDYMDELGADHKDLR